MIKQRTLWLFTHSILVYLIWSALNDGNINAQNLLKFWIWFIFIISLLALIGKKHRSEKESRRSVPQWFGMFYTMGCTVFMAYHGWFLYASLFFIQELFTIGLYDKTFADRKEDGA